VATAQYAQLQEVVNTFKTSLPPVRVPDDLSNPLGRGNIHFGDLDFSMLIEMRRVHQTKYAVTGVRKRLENKTNTARVKVIQEFHNVLKAVQDDSAIGTGIERLARWRTAAPGGREGIVDGTRPPNLGPGNAANAAMAAATVSKKVCRSSYLR
jgi:hypothetical protein